MAYIGSRFGIAANGAGLLASRMCLVHTDTHTHTHAHYNPKPSNICMYVHTCYVLIKPPIPYIASSLLCLLRVFTSYLNFGS
jgi:hypothetical protein